MRTSRPATCALAVLTAAVLLSACSGSGGSQSSGVTPSSGVDSVHQPSDTFVGLKWMGDVHPDHHKSWVARDETSAARLVFASDVGTNDVYIFALPDFTLKGTLTGFNKPQGECSDQKGHVYIANTDSSQVLEYSRQGILINTYADTYGYPVGCAINPINGNLAVTNIHGFDGAGQVLIYTSPTSPPTVLTDPVQYYYFFDGYDPEGDLWVDGKDAKGAYMVSDCGVSGSTCTKIKLRDGRIHSPGTVQFDVFEQAWVLFDQGPCADGGPCSYWVYKNDNYRLSEPNTYETYMGGPACDLIQAVIREPKGATAGNEFVVGGDYEAACDNASTSEDRWPYTPQLNANPTNYTTKYVSHPVGAAISVK
jgi:hypothetical protein